MIFLYTPIWGSDWCRAYSDDGSLFIGYIYRKRILPFDKCPVITVLKIDKDSLYYVDEYPIVAIPYQFAGDSMTIDADGTTIVQHISFRKDTLVMKNQWGDVSCFVPVK